MTYFLVLIDMIAGGVVVVVNDNGNRSSIFEGDFIDALVSFAIDVWYTAVVIGGSFSDTDGAGRMSSLGSSVFVGAYALPGRSSFGRNASVGKGSPGSTPSESNR